MRSKSRANPLLFAAKSFGLLALWIPSTWAQTFVVVDRDEKGDLIQRGVELPNLAGREAFIGRNFIIVKGGEKTPIGFTEGADEGLNLRAATAYYHLEKAKAYLDAKAATTPQLAPLRSAVRYPIVVRIEMTLPYSSASHWVTDGSESFNNSLAIAASDSNRGKEIAPWGQELWFYKQKKITRSGSTNQVFTVLNQRSFKNMMLQQMTYPEMVSIGQKLSFGETPFWPAHIASVGTSLLVSEALMPFLQLVTRPFKTPFSIDTGMIPEVIYHEFSHLVFSERLGLFQPRSVVEGYPNFFAYQASGVRDLNARAKKFVKGVASKRAKSKEGYSMMVDQAGLYAATGSFMYSLLYRLEQAFGPEEADAILYGATEFLDRSSDVRMDFTRAVLMSIQRHSKNPITQALRAQNVFQEKGL
jgi:hypothetical protein